MYIKLLQSTTAVVIVINRLVVAVSGWLPFTMVYKIPRDCPICTARQLKDLSSHLRQSHALTPADRKYFLDKAAQGLKSAEPDIADGSISDSDSNNSTVVAPSSITDNDHEEDDDEDATSMEQADDDDESSDDAAVGENEPPEESDSVQEEADDEKVSLETFGDESDGGEGAEMEQLTENAGSSGESTDPDDNKSSSSQTEKVHRSRGSPRYSQKASPRIKDSLRDSFKSVALNPIEDQEDSEIDSSGGDSSEDEEQDGQCLWDAILNDTYESHPTLMERSGGDSMMFKELFQLAFLGKCKRWFLCFRWFLENDDTWARIMETKEKMERRKGFGDEEALMNATDERKYILYDLIPWQHIQSKYDE
jgi:hypothetical protein